MVHFNELTITPDGKYLIIDVSVLSETYYKDVYIDSVVIDNQNTYLSSGPSSEPVYSYSVPEKTSLLTNEPMNLKHLRLVLGRFDLQDLNNMFFVYVRTKGTPAPETPCGLDNMTTMGTVVNMYPFYQQAMNYIGELADKCGVSPNFTDFILKQKGLEVAIKTGNYPDAIKYYNKFFLGKSNQIVVKGGCSCGHS
jgi:hypothetical protein